MRPDQETFETRPRHNGRSPIRNGRYSTFPPVSGVQYNRWQITIGRDVATHEYDDLGTAVRAVDLWRFIRNGGDYKTGNGDKVHLNR